MSPAAPRPVTPARLPLLAGLVLSVLVLAAVVTDQVVLHSIVQHVHDVYSPHGQNPDPGVLYVVLETTQVVGVLLWAAFLALDARGARWAGGAGVCVLVCALGVAGLGLLASEHGSTVLPVVWGVLAALPCVAGVAAVVQQFRPRASLPA